MQILRRSIYKIDGGEMRDLVILQPPTYTPNGRGGETVTYPSGNFITAYALVHPGGNARELQEANLTYDNIITIYIRYNSALNSNWKVSYDGDIYSIHKSSDVDAKRRFIQLLCYAKS
jgi:SPP1 family predicted phage head-tail adaptor